MKLSEQFTIKISEQKLVGYALSPTHKLGSLKAAYFKSYGFTSANSNEFMEAILAMVNDSTVTSTIKNNYGTLYSVDGKIQASGHKSLSIRTIWMVKHQSNMAELVTVYPK